MRTFIILISTLAVAAAEWPAPKASVVFSADGYVEIANATLAPTKTSTYRAIFDASRPADKPTELLRALNMAGSELNALATANIPLANAKFAIVFHGPAVDGILDEAHYKAKFGTNLFGREILPAHEKLHPLSSSPRLLLSLDYS